MEAQHVHHADLREAARKEVGPLVGGRRDEQAAVGAAHDRELGGRAVAKLVQLLGAGREVVKDVLLAQVRARVAPLDAVLAAAA